MLLYSRLTWIVFVVWAFLAPAIHAQESPKNIILFIADGWSENHIAMSSYFHHGEAGGQVYHNFEHAYFMSTYPGMSDGIAYSNDKHAFNTGYSSDSAWSSPDYLRRNPTGSAASGTALATGFKTAMDAISVDRDSAALTTISERAFAMGKSTGLVTSVPLSHATPAVFAAHNTDRDNYAAIANEMIIDSRLRVLMGCGHPYYTNDGVHSDTVVWQDGQEYIGGMGTWNNLLNSSIVFDSVTINGNNTVSDIDGDGYPDAWALVQDSADFVALANGPVPERVLGVPKVATTLQQSRDYPDSTLSAAPYQVPFIAGVPTLKDMTKAALNILDGDQEGMFLMVEGGAIDWASHSNQEERLIEEQHAFDDAVQAAVQWVQEKSSWQETMIIVMGDHECGFLTGPDYPGDDPVLNYDVLNNGIGQLAEHQWNDYRHTNQLIPLFANGTGAERINIYADELDFHRGRYLSNADLGRALLDMWPAPQDVAPEPENVIVMVGKGMGYNQLRATEYYHGEQPPFQSWPVNTASGTWPAMSMPLTETENAAAYDTWYNSTQAWTDTSFVKRSPTDAAAAATALFTGKKTAVQAIGISPNSSPIPSLADRAFATGKSTGLVTSVQVSSATPAALAAHNANSNNFASIANEMIIDSRLSVLMGCGHPYYTNDAVYSSEPVWQEGREYLGGLGTWQNLRNHDVIYDSTTVNGNNLLQDVNGDGVPDPWSLVQDSTAFVDLAEGPTPVRVMGVPKVATTLQQGRDDTGGDATPYAIPFNQNIPKLQDMTRAALNVLDNNNNGFFLMVEGGAIHDACRERQKARLIEEQKAFSDAVDAVTNWVTENSSWDETLVVVTGNHETGYLVGPQYGSSNDLASAYPLEDNGPGQLPEMQFLNDSPTNQLVPFFSRGKGCEVFDRLAGELDYLRGRYLHNTALAQGISRMWEALPEAPPDIDEGQLVNNDRIDTTADAFKIYPNPASNYVFLESPDFFSKGKIRITDLRGCVLVDKEVRRSRTSIDVGALSKGIYLIELVTADTSIYREKLIVE